MEWAEYDYYREFLVDETQKIIGEINRNYFPGDKDIWYAFIDDKNLGRYFGKLNARQAVECALELKGKNHG